ncbi:MAG: hypothetical protein K6F68_06645 [Clostridiales bacterium]|nr:hypothetical protein [Clostridiales bacterium]
MFDNSGSMYKNGELAWSRATYAMEVFAAMLNEGDRLSIYPMNPISVDGVSYRKEDSPLVITGPEQASCIRRIFTSNASYTPIETLSYAHDGLMAQSGERWLIVLTDGDVFHRNGNERIENTAEVLKKDYLEPYSRDMNVLYLAIGSRAVSPDCTPRGDYVLSVEKENDSTRILSKLTAMCNMIFGRDTLPASHFSGNVMDIDVSLNKLIVFVQGQDVSSVTVTDSQGNRLTPVQNGSYATRYPESGVGGQFESECQTDTSLQGMMMTYAGCKGDKYTLSYSGTASSVEAYYEPNVDMEFTFTDENGNNVDPNDLYEGNYVISFGMKDGMTDEYTESDLLGDVYYSGHYYLNGETHEINHSGKKGSVSVSLKLGDKFNADMLVTYLGGYQIFKDSSDFGWPDGGLEVKPRPAGDLTVVITGGQEVYQLTTLEQGAPFIAEVYYQGVKLTGEELQKTELTWDPDLSGAELRKIFCDDHYEIVLLHKNPNDPESTPTGTFTFPVSAIYTPPASEEARSQPVSFTYAIEDARQQLEVKIVAKQDYYVIYQLDESYPLRAEITINGRKLTPEEFADTEFKADCQGLDFDVEALPDESAYLIKLKKTDSSVPGIYKVSCTASHPDEIERISTGEDSRIITLNNLPAWAKFAIGALLALLAILLLIAILNIRALPTKLHTKRRDCSMTVDDEDVTQNAAFDAKIDGKRLKVQSRYAGKAFGVAMDVKPGKGSCIKTPHAKRSAEVASASVVRNGNATITEATIGSAKYVLDEDTQKFVRMPKNDKPFTLRNGANIIYSGTMLNNGEPKSFSVRIKTNFKKKR